MSRFMVGESPCEVDKILAVARRKAIFLAFLWFALGLCACSARPVVPAPTGVDAVGAAVSTTPTRTVTASQTPSPSPIPSATRTPTPTQTPTATPTLTPTAWGGFRAGQLVAYFDEADLFSNNMDGSDPKNLTQGIMPGSFPANLGWSADGQWVFFTEGQLCSGFCPTHLWAARWDGSEVKLIYDNPVDSQEFAFQPNSAGFVFGCGKEAGQVDSENKLFCKGTTDDFVVAPLGITGLNPSYSPDGRYLAWNTFVEERGRFFMELYAWEENTDQPILLAKYETNNNGGEFTWLNDSQTLVFLERARGSCEMKSIKIGAETPVLHQKLDACYFASFLNKSSPDGRYLLYYHQKYPYILDVSAPDTAVLVRNLFDARLAWSPDGKLIAFPQGKLAQLVNPQDGTSGEITEELALYRLSAWLPEFHVFFNLDEWHVIALQP